MRLANAGQSLRPRSRLLSGSNMGSDILYELYQASKCEALVMDGPTEHNHCLFGMQ